MAENNKIYITANELAEMLGVSVGHGSIMKKKFWQRLWSGMKSNGSREELMKNIWMCIIW